jgi:protease-4
VWTGADAKEHGLVDELGGLRVALDLARERAGLAPSDELDARVFPRPPLPSRLRPPQSSEDPAAATARLRLEAWGPFADVATRLGLPVYGPLMLADGYRLAW